MERRFYSTYSVRFDECDMYGNLSPAFALRYFQDIAGRDSGEAALPPEYNWLARRTLIWFNRPVRVRSEIEIETYPLGFSRVTAQRGYFLRVKGSGSSEPEIVARTMWVYVDPRGRPARIPEEAYRFWLPDGPKTQEPDPAWPDFPEHPPIVTTSTVRFSQLDILAHKNNTSYFDTLDDAGWEAKTRAVGITPLNVPGALVPEYYDIEYLESARWGDRLEVYNWFGVENPANATNFERLQQIRNNGKVLARSLSRWRWHTEII
jgi:acyl-CoA thioesterase FadM